MDKNLPDGNQHFIIFKTEDNSVAVDVLFQGETVWLTLDQMGYAVRQGQIDDFPPYQEYFRRGRT